MNAASATLRFKRFPVRPRRARVLQSLAAHLLCDSPEFRQCQTAFLPVRDVFCAPLASRIR